MEQPTEESRNLGISSVQTRPETVYSHLDRVKTIVRYYKDRKEALTPNNIEYLQEHFEDLSERPLGDEKLNLEDSKFIITMLQEIRK